MSPGSGILSQHREPEDGLFCTIFVAVTTPWRRGAKLACLQKEVSNLGQDFSIPRPDRGIQPVVAEIHCVLPVAAWLPNLEIFDLRGTKSDLGKRPTEVVLWYRRLRPFYRWENRETVSVASLQGKKKKKQTQPFTAHLCLNCRWGALVVTL